MTSDNAFEFKNSGQGEVPFKIDAAQLVQYQNAAGFEPVFLGMQPMGNLKTFLTER